MHQHISKQPLLVYVFNTGDIKKKIRFNYEICLGRKDFSPTFSYNIEQLIVKDQGEKKWD